MLTDTKRDAISARESEKLDSAWKVYSPLPHLDITVVTYQTVVSTYKYWEKIALLVQSLPEDQRKLAKALTTHALRASFNTSDVVCGAVVASTSNLNNHS